MLTVQTRENSKGNWWSNTTHAGYDICEEAETIAEARRLMGERLEKNGYTGEINWEAPQYYLKKANVRSEIGYAAYRIDRGCVA